MSDENGNHLRHHLTIRRCTYRACYQGQHYGLEGVSIQGFNTINFYDMPDVWVRWKRYAPQPPRPTAWRGGLETMTWSLGVTQNHIGSHVVRCVNDWGDSKLPITTKVTGLGFETLTFLITPNLLALISVTTSHHHLTEQTYLSPWKNLAFARND